MNKILRQLLDASVFEVGDNDDRVKQLESSVADVVKLFNADKKLVVPYAIVSLDSNTESTNGILANVEGIVKEHWTTLRQKFPDTPKTLLRAVIFSALYEFASNNIIGARLFFYTASNFYPFVKLDREKNSFEIALVEIKAIVEKASLEEWTVKADFPTFKLPPLKASELADPLTVGSLEPVINKFFADFKKVTNDLLSSSFKSMFASDKRAKLLWWKETLYSQNLGTSYREIAKAILPVVMAKDLQIQVQTNIPISVDYLLKETMTLVASDAKEKVKISDLLKELISEENKLVLKQILLEPQTTFERITFTDFLASCAWNKLSIKDFSKRVGINDKLLISPDELSVIILHDLICETINRG